MYRKYNAHGGAEWLGHEERGAGYLQAFGSQAHAQLQSQLQLQRHVQPKVSATAWTHSPNTVFGLVLFFFFFHNEKTYRLLFQVLVHLLSSFLLCVIA